MQAEAATGAPPATFHRPGGAWLSGHLFLRGRNSFTPECDAVLAEVVHPFAARCLERGAIEGFFFIRYGELGPHLRLRFYGDPAVLEAEVAPALEEHLRDALPAGDAGAPSLEPAAVTRPSGHAALRWIAYEPEVERYGGPHAIAVAEELFHCSSQVSIALLGRSPVADRAVRLGRVLPTLVTLLAAFTGDPAEAAALARLHRDSFAGSPTAGNVADYRPAFDSGYARQAEALGERIRSFWTAVQEDVPLPAPLDAYLEGARAARRRLEALVEAGRLVRGGHAVRGWGDVRRMLLPSYGHMTNNRMGISPREEGYLMHMVDLTLGGGQPGRVPVHGA